MIKYFYRYVCDTPGCKAVTQVSPDTVPPGWVEGEHPTADDQNRSYTFCPVHAPLYEVAMETCRVWLIAREAAYDAARKQMDDQIEAWKEQNPHPATPPGLFPVQIDEQP